MRSKPPVTQKEFDYDKSMTLMSVTDPDSRIVYANEAFVQLSGYSADELLGQPHNIVRHPDMPREAFLDMWNTLKEGKSWTGLVKNRNKSGDHYWVRANATPMMRDGVCAGYISVRTKPSREEIQATERLYADVKAGRAQGIRFHQGLVVRTGLMAWTSLLQRISVAARIHLAIGVSWLVYAMLGLFLGLEWSHWALFAVLSFLCAGLADFWLQRQITAPLQLVAEQAQAMASGHTEKRVHLNRVDEIGLIMRSVNQCGLNLRSLVDDVASQVSGIYQASEHMEHSSSSLAERSEQSASGVVQTAAAMDELASTIQQNASTSEKAREMAVTASDAAVHGGEVVGKVVSTMDAISTHSKRIADIIGVIDGIAFQTNILALNAAVEAARAGEQGRGFAVVASEVRNLAQRSASAAKEIKELIETSVNAVEGGTQLVDDAGRSMQNIVQRVKHVTDLIAEISSASREQSIGVEQACAGVAQLDNATQQNTGLIVAEAEQARHLMERSNRLVSAISVYQGRKRDVQLF